MWLIGLSWLVFWLMLEVFTIGILKAALVTAIIFLILGLLYERSWPLKR